MDIDRNQPHILPAGQHFGTTLQSVTCGEITLSAIRYDGATSSGRHGNERASVLFVQDGQCIKQVAGLTLELGSGSGLFLPPEELQHDVFPTNTIFLAAEFSPIFFSRLDGAAVHSDSAFTLPASHTAALRHQMHQELLVPDQFSGVILEGLILSSVAQVSRHVTRRQRTMPLWLLQTKAFLDETTSAIPSMEDIARVGGVHPAYLSREFRRWLGCAPGEYLRQVRVKHAQRKLEKTTTSIADIALETGFADQSHFSRIFRKYVGLTPSAYRYVRSPKNP